MTSGVMWHDIDSFDWLYGFYMAALVGIVSGSGISIYMCHENQPNKSNLVLYKLLFHCNNHLKQL